MAVTISDVESLASKGWSQLNDTKKQDLLDDAKKERDTIYSGRVARTPILDGDETVFTKNLAAHKWELAEGGQAQSQNTQGGSVNYNTVTGDIYEYLSLTNYGITCLEHVRDNQGIAMVRTH